MNVFIYMHTHTYIRRYTHTYIRRYTHTYIRIYTHTYIYLFFSPPLPFSSCNHHLRNIPFIRKYLNEDTLKMLIHNYVLSRLDYCNSVYYKLPNILLKKIQNIQNRAARLIKKIPLRERITPASIDRASLAPDESKNYI